MHALPLLSTPQQSSLPATMPSFTPSTSLRNWIPMPSPYQLGLLPPPLNLDQQQFPPSTPTSMSWRLGKSERLRCLLSLLSSHANGCYSQSPKRHLPRLFPQPLPPLQAEQARPHSHRRLTISPRQSLPACLPSASSRLRTSDSLQTRSYLLPFNMP